MKVIAVLLFLIVSFSSVAQKSFPSQFVGHWQGEINWYRQGAARPKRNKMQVVIQPTDSANQYTWKIIYGEKEEDTRPYLIKLVDTASGRWVMDEQNGILLDQYWIGDKLYCVFGLSGVTIVNAYWREGEHLMVEFASYPSKSVRTSGEGTEESPTVESYAVRSYQKGILSRLKPAQNLPLRKPKK
jgi:hypothetical protein